jgi:CheY-like chemotaxis protein
MTAPIRVVIADDSVLLREGLVRLLDDSGFEVVGQAGDAEDLLRKVGAHKPDVAVVDVRMPPTHTDEGLRAAHAIRKEHPSTGVLVLSQYVEEAYALELLSQSTESTGTCSRTASPTWTRSRTPCGGSPTAARRSTRRSSRCCSAGAAARTRCSRSPRASARCSA